MNFKIWKRFFVNNFLTKNLIEILKYFKTMKVEQSTTTKKQSNDYLLVYKYIK